MQDCVRSFEPLCRVSSRDERDNLFVAATLVKKLESRRIMPDDSASFEEPPQQS